MEIQRKVAFPHFKAHTVATKSKIYPEGISVDDEDAFYQLLKERLVQEPEAADFVTFFHTTLDTLWPFITVKLHSFLDKVVNELKKRNAALLLLSLNILDFGRCPSIENIRVERSNLHFPASDKPIQAVKVFFEVFWDNPVKATISVAGASMLSLDGVLLHADVCLSLTDFEADSFIASVELSLLQLPTIYLKFGGAVMNAATLFVDVKEKLHSAILTSVQAYVLPGVIPLRRRAVRSLRDSFAMSPLPEGILTLTVRGGEGLKPIDSVLNRYATVKLGSDNKRWLLNNIQDFLVKETLVVSSLQQYIEIELLDEISGTMWNLWESAGGLFMSVERLKHLVTTSKRLYNEDFARLSLRENRGARKGQGKLLVDVTWTPFNPAEEGQNVPLKYLRISTFNVRVKTGDLSKLKEVKLLLTLTVYMSEKDDLTTSVQLGDIPKKNSELPSGVDLEAPIGGFGILLPAGAQKARLTLQGNLEFQEHYYFDLDSSPTQPLEEDTIPYRLHFTHDSSVSCTLDVLLSVCNLNSAKKPFHVVLSVHDDTTSRRLIRL